MPEIPGGPQPTDLDQENARVRQEIASRQEAEYAQCLDWAIEAFGHGWFPSGRHFLIEKDDEERCRREGGKPQVAATVFTVRNPVGEKRHFAVSEGGQVVECAGYEQGFGEMFLELHPTRTIEVREQLVHPHRYRICFGAYELYEPKTAEELAELRVSREQKKKERELKKWQEANPLLAWAGIKPDA